MITIRKEEQRLAGRLEVVEGYIERHSAHKTEQFTRLKVNRDDAATVCIYNTEADTIVLIRQFRYAIASKTQEPILEIVAGKVDPGETPLQAAVREAAEECGYRLDPARTEHLASFFVSPGYTSERFHLFYATVTNADKLSFGGGLPEEHEYIDVVEIPLQEFMEMADQQRIDDGKTLTAALYLKLRRAGNR